MANVSRVVASLFSGTAETTLALANLNFDFSLIKVNAPVEFAGVGNALTKRRRHAAESGLSHMTARKLGALFEGTIPQTPRLYEAYGVRASEISSKAEKAKSLVEDLGVFSDFSGPDATTIWAAATSGKVAIAIHLLACLLARFWKSEEAVSIWEELIDARKKELTQSIQEETFQTASVLASQIELSREQLAQWDNSARAWLRYADREREMQQTKLKLVIDDLNSMVVGKASLYESVMDSWTTALQGMEELLKGSSQNIAHTGVILALSSWHLYPDLSVHGNAPVMQNDPLFPHGTVASLYIQINPNKTRSGISWSLSLSHLRYYGAPIITERGYATESSRISFTQFLVCILGSLSLNWGLRSSAPLDVAKVIILINDRLSTPPVWMKMLLDPAKELLSSKDEQSQLNFKLFRLGRERGALMLAPLQNHPSPVFGLTDFSTFFKHTREHLNALRLLRKYADRFFPDANPEDLVLKYRFPLSSIRRITSFKKGVSSMPCLHRMTPGLQHWVPVHAEKHKLLHALQVQPPKYSEIDPNPNPDPNQEAERGRDEESVLVDDEPDAHLYTPMAPTKLPELTITETETLSDTEHPTIETEGVDVIAYVTARPVPVNHVAHSPAYIHLTHLTHDHDHCRSVGDAEHLHYSQKEWVADNEELDQLQIPNKLLPFVISGRDKISLNEGEGDKVVVYKRFIGFGKSYALYATANLVEEHKKASTGPVWGRTSKHKVEMDVTDVIAALEDETLDLSDWLAALFSDPKATHLQYFRSLYLLSHAWQLYGELGQARIDPAVLAKPILECAWASGLGKATNLKSLFSESNKTFTRREAFACISHFETGGIDLKPSQFDGVMAVSNAESIYVAGPLLTDPAAIEDHNRLFRIDGNVGKPGLVLMIPPGDPMTLKPDPAAWRVIDREAYNGQKEDYFSKTSLHLTFTDWSMPLNTGETGRGRRTAEASLVETLVSVLDHGRWVADLDVLAALKKGSGQPDHQFFFSPNCNHDTTKDAETESGNLDEEIIAIKSWDEFLDRPNCPAVVLAHENWEARLAAAVVGVARGDRVFLSRSMACHSCLRELAAFGGVDLANRALFIV